MNKKGRNRFRALSLRKSFVVGIFCWVFHHIAIYAVALSVNEELCDGFVFNRSLPLHLHLDDKFHRTRMIELEARVVLSSPKQPADDSEILRALRDSCQVANFDHLERWGPSECFADLELQVSEWIISEVYPWKRTCLCAFDRQACDLPDITINDRGERCSFKGICQVRFHVDPEGDWDQALRFDSLMRIEIPLEVSTQLPLRSTLDFLHSQLVSICNDRGGSRGKFDPVDCVRGIENQIVEWVASAPKSFPWRLKCEPKDLLPKEFSTSPDHTDIPDDIRQMDIASLQLEVHRLRDKLRDITKAHTMVPSGVYPMLRDMGCTHGNMKRPKLLTGPRRGRLVVDVGLGCEALFLSMPWMQASMFLVWNCCPPTSKS
jgi:hypothetical protein